MNNNNNDSEYKTTIEYPSDMRFDIPLQSD